MSDAPEHVGLSAHRIEALTDGIYAVAMTLLVIELKLPDGADLHGAEALTNAIIGLAPRFEAWLISFLWLAMFWFGHHRGFSHLRRTDGMMISLSLGQLGFVSLMPFCCALIGEYPGGVLVQAIYSLDIAAVAALAMLSARHVYCHPEMTVSPMSDGEYLGARVRTGALIVIGLGAIVVAWATPRNGNLVYLLMLFVMPVSRRLERRVERQRAHA